MWKELAPYLCLLMLFRGDAYGEGGDDFGGRDRHAILQLLDEDLREGDLPVRLETAWKLARLGGDDALAILATGLKSRISVVRAEVVEAMGSLKQAATVPHLLEAVADPDHWVRSAAAAVLADQDQPAAIPSLEKLYEDEAFLVRRNAAVSVHRLGGTSGLKALQGMLADTDWRVRALVVGDLSRLKVADALPSIRPLLSDPDWRVQVAASQAIADLGDRQALTELAELLKSEEVWVRRTAAHALNRLGADAVVSRYVAAADARVGRLDAPEQRATFVSGLTGCAAWVRRLAEAGLGTARDRSVLPVLTARMSRSQVYHQLDAARRLGELNDPAAKHPLHQGLRAEDEWVKLTALESLARVGQPNVHALAGKVVETSLDWVVRQHRVAILGELDRRYVEDAIRNSLGDADAWVRLAAMDCLREADETHDLAEVFSTMETADALEASVPDELRLADASGRYVRDYLRERLEGQSGPEGRAAALALARTSDTSGWKAVAEQLVSEDRSERITAAMTLARIGDVTAVPRMLEHMREDNPWTFHALRGALRSLGDPAVPVLIKALDEDREHIRTMAHAVIEDLAGTKVAFNPKVQDPKRRAAWIERFRLWWDDYTFIRDLGYDSIALFQKAHSLAITGTLAGSTQAKVKELREQKQR